VQVVSTANNLSRLSKPLQSRFRRLHLPPYTKERFLDIAVKVCPKLKEETSRLIGEEVWKQGNKDIRDVISLRKLIRKGDGPEEIEELVKTLAKYTDAN
jgi:ATP-dependent Lon protease